MKIAVLGANGKAGQEIVNEAISRNIDVTAVVRSDNKTKAKKVIQKDILDLTKEDLSQFDAVVNAMGVWDPNKLTLHSEAMQHLIDLLADTKTRLLVVGGAGSLYLDNTHGMMLMESPDFPPEYKPGANAMLKSLDILRKANKVNWVYISPAAFFNPTGAKSGKYILAGEEFTLNDSGNSEISYADYAVAMCDEIINNKHNQVRISVVANY